MIKKILILTSVPAPYRYEVFNLLSKEYKIETFYEKYREPERNEEWFIKDNVDILENYESNIRYKRVIKDLKKFDYVFIYEYSAPAAWKLMIKCILLKVPYAINCDGAFVKKSSVKDILKRFFVRHAEICFASGIYAANYFKHLGATDEKIEYHKFTSLFAKQILNEKLPEMQKKKIRHDLGVPERICVIAVGRFIKSKGFDILIDAWKTIPKHYHLIIIGGGAEKCNYEKQIQKEKLTNINIYDYMDKDKLIKYYQASDIFVLPTKADVWGLVINEAMANGLPVITTENCVAGMELVENGVNGYIVPINNSKAISEAIIKIGENDELRSQMGNNNLQKIKDYNYENVAKSHINAVKRWELKNKHIVK